MATLTMFNSFTTEAAAGTHVAMLNSSTDTIRIALTASTPNVATWTTKAQIVGEIAYTNISETWPIDITNTTSQAGTTITVGTADTVVATATDTVPTFRYLIFYNDDAASDELIGYADHGSAVDLVTSQVFTADFSTDELLEMG